MAMPANRFMHMITASLFRSLATKLENISMLQLPTFTYASDLTVPVASASALESDMGSTAVASLTDADFTALFQAGTTPASRHYVVGEEATSIVLGAHGDHCLEVVTTPSSIGSNQVSAFHNISGIPANAPIVIEQIVEFGNDWTKGGVFAVQKLGSGIQARATNDDSYVVGNSTNKTGWSARFEVYGPNGPNSAFTENDPNIGAYIYYVGWEDGDYLARHVETNVVAKAGSVYHMKMIVTPNTTGNSDGSITIEVNEIDASGAVLATDTTTKSGLMWMQGEFGIDGLSFDAFTGGNNTDYSAVGGVFSTCYRDIKIN